MFRTSKPRLQNKLLCYLAHPNLPDEGTRTSNLISKKNAKFARAHLQVKKRDSGKMQTKEIQTMDAGPGNAGIAAGLQGQAAGQAPTLIDIIKTILHKNYSKM